jgi:hypothetical protein
VRAPTPGWQLELVTQLNILSVGLGQPEFKLSKFWIGRFFVVKAIRTRLGLEMIERMAETLDETRNVGCDLGSGQNRITPVRVKGAFGWYLNLDGFNGSLRPNPAPPLP